MRVVSYRKGHGRPELKATRNLDELAMLTEAAISLTNVERWAQLRVMQTALKSASNGQRPASIVSKELRDHSKKTQYETTVVDNFLRIGAQSFALHGTEALWERGVPEGRPGPRRAVDVCLFNSRRNEESRVEFGFYSREKLANDARKLYELPPEQGLIVTNYIILWQMCENERVLSSSKEWRDECVDAAQEMSGQNFEIDLKIASSQDLFSESVNNTRSVNIGIFYLRSLASDDVEVAGDI